MAGLILRALFDACPETLLLLKSVDFPGLLPVIFLLAALTKTPYVGMQLHTKPRDGSVVDQMPRVVKVPGVRNSQKRDANSV